MTGALPYLIVTSARGRIRAQLARLRNPRYAVALVFGLLYIWGVYLRPTRHAEAVSTGLGAVVGPLAPLFGLVYFAWLWIFGADRNALAFTEAEATMLFTAPVSRRALMIYKIARTQLTILTTSLIWTVIFRQGGTLTQALTHVIGYWVVLSALNLNRLGVALIHASAGEHGLRGARRHWFAISVVIAMLAAVALPIYGARGQFSIARLGATGEVLDRALGTTAASLALLPFNLVLAPAGAAPGRAWLAAIGPALLILALLLLWVLSTDAAFEEAAAEASTRQALRVAALRARREGGGATPKINARRTLPLAPIGAPAMALVWKNTLWLLRTGQVRGLLTPPAVAFALIAAFGTRSSTWSLAITTVSLALAGMMLLFGPMALRNDLRSELLRLPLLKTLPLTGHEIVIAEVASSAVPVAITQYLLALAALVAIGFTENPVLTLETRIALCIAGLVVVLGLNGVMFMIHNGLALLFPGWIRLGGRGASEIETMGLSMLTMVVVLVMLTLSLIVPAVAGGIIWLVLRPHVDAAILVGGVIGGLILLGEATMLAFSLAGSIERAEPMHVES